MNLKIVFILIDLKIIINFVNLIKTSENKNYKAKIVNLFSIDITLQIIIRFYKNNIILNDSYKILAIFLKLRIILNNKISFNSLKNNISINEEGY